MKNQSLDLNQNYQASSNLISRRNQNNTAIVMKVDDANVFYKIDGVAAYVWHLFQTPATAQFALNTLTQKFSGVAAATIQDDLTQFLNKLINLGVLTTSTESAKPAQTDLFVNSIASLETYEFGDIKEFDLAQIESEVLSESVYLDVFAGSDLRLKKDVESLKNPLEKILALDGISYLWNEQTASPQAPKNTQIGLVAQQVAEVMPDLVKKDAATGLLAINYTKITPYLVESIKELKSLIDSQNQKITQLETELKKLKQH